jgi:hypothetical protein
LLGKLAKLHEAAFCFIQWNCPIVQPKTYLPPVSDFRFNLVRRNYRGGRNWKAGELVDDEKVDRFEKLKRLDS